jgi:hypothetical protein
MSKEQLILRLVIPAQAGIGSRKFKNAYLVRFARGFKSLSPPRAPRKQMFAWVESGVFFYKKTCVLTHVQKQQFFT